MKKGRLKKQNIFIFANIVILLTITCFYAYRLIHYYRIEHPKADKKLNLVEKIILKKNITSIGDGLYKEDNLYVFKGKEVNNYLKYSGFLFRIISVDKNNNVKLIVDDSLTNIAWGIKSNYADSYIKAWLNGKNDNEGIFYKSLNIPEDYLNETSFCTEIVTKDNEKCIDNEIETVGLLSLKEYNQAGGSKSYLNTNNYWWLSNPSEEGIWYVNVDGKIDDVSNLGKNYYSYGVRPVITIKGSSSITGDGTKDNPYVLDKEQGNTLKDKNIGSYINYSNLTFRIIERNDNYIRLVLDGFIKDNDEVLERIYSTNSTIYSTTTDIGYYLNTTFYHSLDKTYMKEGFIYTNRYDETVDFDYRNIFESKINANIGMMQVGDLFMNEYNDFFLASRTSTYEGTIYKVVENSRLYADLPTNKAKIRPTIFLDRDSLIISGNGSKESPYIIGDTK